MQATKMEADELIESDREILDELQKGRCTPAVLVDWTGLSKQTIHNRLNVLVAAGHVEKAHESGLYELVSDPRDD
ncbi:winged helix-turn-helix transcriptional regulator [Halobacterium salinarum]|nr:winged helix-turn-helix domain-containing protein [Halobacterium salinarum]MCF2240390.1 winged helix-turn-helix transcriptional regulator [Halobacterium salinarum]